MLQKRSSDVLDRRAPQFIWVLLSVLLSTAFHSTATCQMIIAHRGASHDAPENTLAAYELAWKLDADGIEADCHLTSDMKIVCIHDDDTSRICPGMPILRIAESDLATLQQLDVGSWKDPKFSGERMPTISQVLATVPSGKKIFLELKAGLEILPILKDELAQCSLKPEQVHIICFKSSVIRQARELMPEYATSWLVDYQKQAGATGRPKDWRPTFEYVLDRLVEIGATGLDSRDVAKIVDQKFVNDVKNSGAEFHVWTIDDPENAIRLRSLGVTSITTNRPALLKCFLNADNSK